MRGTYHGKYGDAKAQIIAIFEDSLNRWTKPRVPEVAKNVGCTEPYVRMLAKDFGYNFAIDRTHLQDCKCTKCRWKMEGIKNA